MDIVKPAMKQSITFRMTVTVCFFLITFQLVLATLTFFYFKKEFTQTISNQQFTLLTVVTQNIDQKLESSQAVITGVARLVTPETIRSPETAQRFLDGRPGTLSIFDNGLFLFSPAGRIIAESPYRANRRGRDISFREFYKRTVSTGQPHISDPYISTHTPGAPAVMFTVPIRDKEGQLIAIIGGSLNLLHDNFLGELSRTRIADTGYLYLITRERVLIMHPDKTRIMQKPLLPGANKLLERAINGFEGSGENANTREVKSLTSFKHLRTTNWIMGANYPLAEAYAPIYHIQQYFLAVLFIVMLLSMLVVRLMMERFTSALVRFAQHVKNIANKRGEERLFCHNYNDEIGILARTFNTMIQLEDLKNQELVHTSTHDGLTGLFNRACFDSELERLARGRNIPISVVVVDIDGLKRCNDTYGHATGDALIRAAAGVLIESFRAEDIVARIGGDEFAVLLPGVDTDQVQTALERVRNVESRMPLVDGVYRLSISLGCHTSKTSEGLLDAFKQADQHMYLHKAKRKQSSALTS